MAQKPPDIVATVTEDLGLDFHIPRLLSAVLAQLGGPGTKVRIDIRKWYKKRTPKQNNTIWGHDYPLILAFMAQNGEPGYTAEELHDFHKRTFIGFEKSEKFPGMYRIKSSTELDTKEFNEKFREQICRFWSERGLFIPDPEPQNK